MNYVVFLDAGAGELEKILSGTKSMLLKASDPADPAHLTINPGDDLYFLRNIGDCDLRVKATVSHVLLITNQNGEDLPRILKEMQTRLQLTEGQFNDWSARGQLLCIEFCSAHKIESIHIAPDKIMDRPIDGSHWITFEQLSQIT